jgi:hypothetical protein
MGVRAAERLNLRGRGKRKGMKKPGQMRGIRPGVMRDGQSVAWK